jgi:hypothetical protein
MGISIEVDAAGIRHFSPRSEHFGAGIVLASALFFIPAPD